MKNILKKSTMLLLCVLLMGGILTPIFAQAADTVTNSQDDEYIYYTDLFYAYPYYLANDPFLLAYQSDVIGLSNTIYSNYNNSLVEWSTALEHGLETATSLSQTLQFFSDLYGWSNYRYNDALDSANEYVAQQLLNSNHGEMQGTCERIFKSAEKISKYVEKTVDDESDTHLCVKAAIDKMKEGYSEYFSGVTNIDFDNFWNSIGDNLGAISEGIEAAEAISIALMFEDARIAHLDNIINVLEKQTENTVLKQGMARLKNQLCNNFVSNFTSNYLGENFLLLKMIDKLGELGSTITGTNTIFALLGVVKVAVFDIISNPPEYADILAFEVLREYSKNIHATIGNAASVFDDGPFVSDEIKKYESVFTIYTAINQATVDLGKNIAKASNPYSNKIYSFLQKHIGDGTTEIVLKSEGINDIKLDPSTLTSADVILDQMRELKGRGIKNTTLVVGSASMLFNVLDSLLFEPLVESAKENLVVIDSFENEYSHCNIYKTFIESVKNTILQTEKGSRVTSASICNSWTYSVNGDTQIRLQSDEVESGCIYTFNDFIQGNVSLSGSYAVPSGLKFGINGSFTMGCWDSLTISADSSLVVKKNLNVNAWGWSTGYRSTILNDGYLDVQNTLSGYGFLKGSGKYVFNNVTPSVESAIIFENATYEFSGNVSQVIECVSSSVIISGETEQSISLKGTIRSLDVFSTRLTLTSNASVSDYIDFHGNDVNVLNAISVSNGTIIKEGSNYKNLYFSDRYTLTNNICADYMEFNGGLTVESGSHVLDGYAFFWYGDNFITINEDAELCINGDAEGCEWRWQPIRTSVQNNGTMTVTGTLYYRWNLGGNGTYNLNNTSGEYITLLGGLFNIYGNTINPINVSNANSVNISGKEKQSIGLSGTVQCLVLNNPTITKFLSPLRITSLFNHNGNSFELYNNGTGSSFVDYDGDGIKDNIDPYPTCATHNYGEWYEIQVPTCTATGTAERECTVCHHKETKTTDAKGHINAEVVVENKVDSNCTTDGSYDNVVYCLICSVEISREKKTINKLGHDHSIEWTIDVEPTCTTVGSKSHHCSRCDDKANVTTISANGHAFNQWLQIVAPGNETKGEERRDCVNCDYFETREIAVLGYLQTFIDAVENLSENETIDNKYNELYSALQLYAKLTTQEKEEANEAFLVLRAAIEAYNSEAETVNTELGNATKIAFIPISASFTFIAALWFLFKKKFWIK